MPSGVRGVHPALHECRRPAHPSSHRASLRGQSGESTEVGQAERRRRAARTLTRGAGDRGVIASGACADGPVPAGPVDPGKKFDVICVSPVDETRASTHYRAFYSLQ